MTAKSVLRIVRVFLFADDPRDSEEVESRLAREGLSTHSLPSLDETVVALVDAEVAIGVCLPRSVTIAVERLLREVRRAGGSARIIVVSRTELSEADCDRLLALGARHVIHGGSVAERAVDATLLLARELVACHFETSRGVHILLNHQERRVLSYSDRETVRTESLTDQELRFLGLLMERPGDVVSTSAVLARVWVTKETSDRSKLSRLKRKLNAKLHRLESGVEIGVVARLGYVFVEGGVRTRPKESLLATNFHTF